MPHVDLTSVWIPGGLIGILVLIMIRLFILERRSAAALATERGSTAPVEVTMPSATEAPAAAEAPPVVAAPAEPAPETQASAAAAEAPKAEAPAPAKKAKPSFVWRTAWIWLPFLAGFAGQAYLDIFKPYIDPLIEKAAG